MHGVFSLRICVADSRRVSAPLYFENLGMIPDPMSFYLVGAEMTTLILVMGMAKSVLLRWHEVESHVLVMVWLDFTSMILSWRLADAARTRFNLYDLVIKRLAVATRRFHSSAQVLQVPVRVFSDFFHLIHDRVTWSCCVFRFSFFF